MSNIARFIQLTDFLSDETCCVCGVVFALPDSLQKALRRTHDRFYCPNGHGQSYTGKSESEKLKEQLAQSDGRLHQALREKSDLEKKVAKLAKRVKNGVCPCCKRTFKQLAAHMKTKHPEYAS